MNIGAIRESLRTAVDYNSHNLPDSVDDINIEDVEEVAEYWPLIIRDADREKLTRLFRTEVQEHDDFEELEDFYEEVRLIPELKEIVLAKITSFLSATDDLSTLIQEWNLQEYEKDDEPLLLLKKRIIELIEEEDSPTVLQETLDEIDAPEHLEIIYLEEDETILSQAIANRLAKLLKKDVDTMSDPNDVLEMYSNYDDRYQDCDPERVIDWVFLTRVIELINEATDPELLMNLYRDINSDYGLDEVIIEKLCKLIRDIPDNESPPTWFLIISANIEDYEEVASAITMKARVILRNIS